MKMYPSALLFLLLLLSACGVLLPQGETATPQGTITPTQPSPAPGFTLQAATESPTPSVQVTLLLWMPPQFDPTSGTPAGDLLQARLMEFSKRRPGVRIEVRIKSVSGPGGLLDSLTTTSAAAPLALPDLIALPRDVLETAALKGLLHPYDSLTKTLEDPDWYEYAQQLARLQDSVYGLPFAGDALTLVYHPDAVAAPPGDWAVILETNLPLVYAAADPQALFTMTLYLASGGEVRDEQGRPFLDAVILSEVLNFYAEAEAVGVMPYWLTQYQSDDQVWEAFQENRADLAITRTSRYLGDLLDDAAAAPLPTPDGEHFTLATGWVWALATDETAQQALGVELAEFLTTSAFLAQWTEAVGYLPPRSKALNGWSNTSVQALVGQIALSARLHPSADILTSLGAPLQQAVVQVLKRQIDPLPAAQSAAASLASP